MVKLETHLGETNISQEYFANLVGHAASECFGVSGMAVTDATQGLRSIITKKEAPDQGVRVRILNGRLVVDLHIVVTYGVNISAIVKSIVNKVRYTVEEATGMEVARVNVYVDSMKTE
ncbi:Asp23/Gls24 family envelope stress response protein [Clostridiaceae bacterium NSJ-31]|uniref:Asp23/Gls24 family envelope stress response protein n=1 Tax=Ligaoa zhengdingensis TaxID=2763658 RepID=A0A926DYZ3_9FIRM|nr:Asp23/Gls24 family envelope stress response protein [Ligaoa zhengdingensis]MBC8546159.1 Asp23/Gls24 family envelope stress response protein [Ligaoa zhengdingensis]